MATWTNLTFAFGSLLTSTKMTQLDANLDALAEGATGAPEVLLSAIGVNTPTTAVFSMAASATVTVSKGIYQFAGVGGGVGGSVSVQINIGGPWYDYQIFTSLTSYNNAGLVASDGANVRLVNGREDAIPSAVAASIQCHKWE